MSLPPAGSPKRMDVFLRVGLRVLLAVVLLGIGIGFALNRGTCRSGWTKTGGISEYGISDGSVYVSCAMECCKPNPWKCRCEVQCACRRRPDHPGIRN